jgi:hypothetical protein
VLLNGVRAGVAAIRIRPADFLRAHLTIHPACPGRGAGLIVVQRLQPRTGQHDLAD